MTRPCRMRGAFLVTVIVLLVAAALAGAAGAAVPTGNALPSDAELTSCKASPKIAARSVAVATSMAPVGSGRSLLVRVDLYQRPLDGGRWMRRGDVPRLGTWTPPSDPTIGSRPDDVFKYRQAVGRLAVPFAYRFRVGFRWEDADGDVVRSASSWTGVCREPDLRPDLTVVRVRQSAAPLVPSAIRYSILVKNVGVGSARGIAVAAQFPGSERDLGPAVTQTVPRLAPRQSVWIGFTGAGCVGSLAPTFTVDPLNAIEESSETNNVLAATCPSSAPPSVATLG